MRPNPPGLLVQHRVGLDLVKVRIRQLVSVEALYFLNAFGALVFEAPETPSAHFGIATVLTSASTCYRVKAGSKRRSFRKKAA